MPWRSFIKSFSKFFIIKTMKNKILIVTQYFPPDVTAAAFRISETAALLRAGGYDVTILTAHPHRSPVQTMERDEYAQVVRVKISGLSGKETKGYLKHYLSFMVNAIVAGVKLKFRPDFVIASSPPLFVSLAGWLIAKFKRAKFILDIRDIWPDSAVGPGHIEEKSVFYKTGKVLEKFIYRRADIISCVSKGMRDHIVQISKKNIPCLVLYNGLSKKFIDECQFDSQKEWQRSDEFVISYVGNMGYAQNLNQIIDAAAELSTMPVKFALIGEGSVKDALMASAKQKQLQNVSFQNGCSKEAAFASQLQSHALVIILKDSPAFKRTIPSKVFDYLWANKPILFGIEGEGRELLASLPGNFYFDVRNPQTLIDAVRNLYENYDFYKANAMNNREFVLSNFTREKMTELLIAQLKSL